MLAFYERGLRWALRHRMTMLLVTLGDGRGSTSASSSSSRRGSSRSRTPASSWRATEAPQDVSFPRDARAADAGQRDPQRGPGHRPLRLVHRRRAGSARATPARCSSTLKPLPPRKAQRRRDPRAPPRQAREDRGHQHVPAVARRTCASADAWRGRSTSTRSRTRTSTSSATWAPKRPRGAAEAPAAQGRQHATSRTPGSQLDVDIDRDTASRLGITAQAIDDALYDAFGQRVRRDDVHAAQPVPRRPRGRRPRTAARPDALDGIYVQEPRPARRCRCGAIAKHVAVDDRAVGQPPGPVPVGDPLVQPRARTRRSARRSTRSTRRSSTFTCRRASTPTSRAPRRPSRRLSERADARRGRAHHRLHRARHALRELRPPDHDPLDAAVGGIGALLALLLFKVDLSIIAHRRACSCSSAS